MKFLKIQICQKFCLIFMLILVDSFLYPCHCLQKTHPARQLQYCLNQAAGELVANPLNCKDFYLCAENGESVPASCPPNMLFNAANQLCDTAEKVKCNADESSAIQTTSPTTTAATPMEVTQFCLNLKDQQPDSKALVFIASPLNCHQYYMCYYGRALLQECSPNLYWNNKIGKCDLPSKVNCLSSSSDDTNSIQISPGISDVSASSSSDQDFLCPLYGQHIFPHMQRCDFFIYCVKGYGMLQKCPFFHWFDVASGSCRWRTNALCIKDLSLEFGESNKRKLKEN